MSDRSAGVLDFYFLVARAMQHQLDVSRFHVHDWRIERELIACATAFKSAPYHLLFSRPVFIQGRISPLGDAQGAVRDDEFRIEFHGGAEAHAGFAGTMRDIEAEVARLQFGVAESTDRAGEFLGERDLVPSMTCAMAMPSLMRSATSSESICRTLSGCCSPSGRSSGCR